MAQEYEEYGVPTFRPACWQFTASGGTYYFTWHELNGGFADGNPHRPYGLIQPVLASGLDLIRVRHGRAIYMSSGYRCPHGNDDAGGVSDSAHMYGRAADLFDWAGRWNADVEWDFEAFQALRQIAIQTGASALQWDSYKDHHLHIRY
jgi:hypothetical protein